MAEAIVAEAQKEDLFRRCHCVCHHDLSVATTYTTAAIGAITLWWPHHYLGADWRFLLLHHVRSFDYVIQDRCRHVRLRHRRRCRTTILVRTEGVILAEPNGSRLLSPVGRGQPSSSSSCCVSSPHSSGQEVFLSEPSLLLAPVGQETDGLSFPYCFVREGQTVRRLFIAPVGRGPDGPSSFSFSKTYPPHTLFLSRFILRYHRRRRCHCRTTILVPTGDPSSSSLLYSSSSSAVRVDFGT